MDTVFVEFDLITHNEATYAWIYDLTNQYSKEVKDRGGKVKVISEIWNNNEGGYEHVILMITEENAYNYFKEREGKQRLTKVPMFATQSSTKVTGYQTLSIMINVYQEPNNFFVDPKDISCKSINTQEGRLQRVSCEEFLVQLTHKPTGIVVTCGEERSQITNKEMAERLLKAKVYKHQTEK